MKAELEKFIEREAEKQYWALPENSSVTVKEVRSSFTAGANSLAPLLLEAVEALEWYDSANSSERVADGNRAMKTLASIMGKLT